MDEVTETVTCANCGERIAPQHVGACPKCGKEGKNTEVTIKESIPVHSSLNWETRKEYYKEHKGAAATVIGATVLSPFVGLFLAGPIGVIVGLILGAITYYFGPKAITKIIEITKGHA